MTRKLIGWSVRLALLTVILFAMAAVTVLIVIPRATNGVAMTVLTGSMTPTLPVGSIIVDRPVDPGTLRVGAIATYQAEPGVEKYVTHRILEIHTDTTPTTFTFKGDANRAADIDPIPATAIRGQVWFHVPYLGTIRDALQSHGMRGLVLAAVLVLLGGYSLLQISSGLRDSVRKRRSAGSASGAGSNVAPADQGPSPELRCSMIEVPVHAFDGVDPDFVARLLQARCAPAGPGRVRIIVEGSPQRLAVVRELLEPYALPPATDGDRTGGDAVRDDDHHGFRRHHGRDRGHDGHGEHDGHEGHDGHDGHDEHSDGGRHLAVVRETAS
jgi:signal peptidase